MALDVCCGQAIRRLVKVCCADAYLHLSNPELVTETLESVTKFWSVLSEEEREFVSAVGVAIKDQVGWEV
jgi:hypothetical protein